MIIRDILENGETFRGSDGKIYKRNLSRSDVDMDFEHDDVVRVSSTYKQYAKR